MKRTLFRTALLAASLPLLGGCVAALVPVVAGGLISKEQLESKEDESDGVVAVEDSPAPALVREAAVLPEPAPTPVAVASAPVDESTAETVVIESAEAELTPSPPPVSAEQVAEIERPTPAFIGPVDSEPGEEKLAVSVPAATTPVAPAPNFTTRPELPIGAPVEIAMAPTPVNAPLQAAVPVRRAASASSGPTDFRAYDALFGYVESQARRDPVTSPRQSALLAAPGSLSPVRTECSIRPPAILIDLDPGDQSFDSTIAPQANPALGQILTSFRLQEIDIFWISQQRAIAAGAIRKALVASGLDPQGRDGLLLMRRADDRKQARRKELAETHCVLAIGGDTRADFDELYLYLKDETTAQPLEELIGAGWFLTPLPLTEGR